MLIKCSSLQIRASVCGHDQINDLNLFFFYFWGFQRICTFLTSTGGFLISENRIFSICRQKSHELCCLCPRSVQSNGYLKVTLRPDLLHIFSTGTPLVEGSCGLCSGRITHIALKTAWNRFFRPSPHQSLSGQPAAMTSPFQIAADHCPLHTHSRLIRRFTQSSAQLFTAFLSLNSRPPIVLEFSL